MIVSYSTEFLNQLFFFLSRKAQYLLLLLTEPVFQDKLVCVENVPGSTIFTFVLNVVPGNISVLFIVYSSVQE